MPNNKFIFDMVSDDEREQFQNKVLNFNGFVEYLQRIQVTHATYYDNYNKLWNVCIKEKHDNRIINVRFNKDNMFTGISSSFGNKGNAFKNTIGTILLNHFQSVQFGKLDVFWGSHEIDWEGDDDDNK